MNFKKLKILSYGCQMNMAESERMAGTLGKIGCRPTNDLADADVILLNTCCVRETAEEKIYGKIGELKAYKQKNPALVIGIIGCMAQKEGQKIIKRAPHVDFVLGTNKITELAAAVERASENRRRHFVDTDLTTGGIYEGTPLRESKIAAWIPIMQGCDNFCTYCIVPHVRGREKSRPAQEILAEITEAKAAGFAEVMLLGQNVNSYGKNLVQETIADFADLIAAADRTGMERIRFMTSHPKDLSDKVIMAMAKSEHVCRHLHLPVQHAANGILRKMNRGYTKEHYRALAAKIREAMPDIALTTDIIVGFPGETDADFAELLEFIKEMRFDSAYTFLYSKRTGTPAATFTDQVSDETKKARLQQLMAVQNEISLALNEKFTGKRVRVLVEGASKNDSTVWTGRTSENKLVLFAHGDESVGEFCDVKINKAQTWVLKGVIV